LGRFLKGRNFSEAWQSRKTAFGIAHQPCSWPVVGGLAKVCYLPSPGDSEPSINWVHLSENSPMEAVMSGKQTEYRRQDYLLPASLDDYVSEDNPVRAIEAFIDGVHVIWVQKVTLSKSLEYRDKSSKIRRTLLIL
jgi:hypothetical protein